MIIITVHGRHLTEHVQIEVTSLSVSGVAKGRPGRA